MDNAFLGKNGLQWWIGVVEDNKDPLRVYRCRVRIFGWHTEDKIMIPTEDLPWAQASLPGNNSLTFSVPQIGEWVHGHFLDGESGQFPIYTGVLPGVISPKNIKNPNKGFHSPQTKGPSPAKTTQAKDGSGSVSKSDPFVSFPKVSGLPTTNLEAMHLDTAKPLSVTDKIDKKLNDILGPHAASTGDKLTAAATAIASASAPPTEETKDGKITEKKKCGPDDTSLLGDIGKLITSGKDLLADTEKFINSEIESAAASAASSLGITSGLNTISGGIDTASAAVSGAIDFATTAMNDMKAAADKEIAKQLHNLELTAKKYEKMASDSLKKTIDKLSLESGSIGCYILGSIAPSAASITTKLPVIIEPKTKTSKAVVGAVNYPVPVPHDLSAAIPLTQIPSSHEKSLENSISIWKASVNATFPILLESLTQIEASYSSNIFSSGGTVDRVALNTMKYYSNIWIKLKTQKNSIAEAYGKPEVLSELEMYIKPYDEQIKVAANKIPEI
jgi:hypothetical protein